MRNGLGVVQGLYNFIEASPERHVISAEKMNMNRHIGNKDERNALGLPGGGEEGSGQATYFLCKDKDPKPIYKSKLCSIVSTM